MFQKQRSEEWELASPVTSSLPKLGTDCDVPSRAYPKGESHAHTWTDAHECLDWIESISHTKRVCGSVLTMGWVRGQRDPSAHIQSM